MAVAYLTGLRRENVVINTTSATQRSNSLYGGLLHQDNSFRMFFHHIHGFSLTGQRLICFHNKSYRGAQGICGSQWPDLQEQQWWYQKCPEGHKKSFVLLNCGQKVQVTRLKAHPKSLLKRKDLSQTCRPSDPHRGGEDPICATSSVWSPSPPPNSSYGGTWSLQRRKEYHAHSFSMVVSSPRICSKIGTTQHNNDEFATLPVPHLRVTITIKCQQPWQWKALH